MIIKKVRFEPFKAQMLQLLSNIANDKAEKLFNRYFYFIQVGDKEIFVVSEHNINGFVKEALVYFDNFSFLKLKEKVLLALGFTLSTFKEKEEKYLAEVGKSISGYIEPEFTPYLDLERELRATEQTGFNSLPNDALAACLSPTLSQAITLYCFMTQTIDYRLTPLYNKDLADKLGYI